MNRDAIRATAARHGYSDRAKSPEVHALIRACEEAMGPPEQPIPYAASRKNDPRCPTPTPVKPAPNHPWGKRSAR